MKLIQITDLHLSSQRGEHVHKADVWASFDAVLKCVKAQSPDLVIATGDLVDQPDLQSYALLREALLSLELPVIALAGNHDDPEMMDTYLMGDQIQAPEKLTQGCWQIDFIDSFLPGESGGYIDEVCLQRISRLVPVSASLKRIIFMHHQPYPIGSEWIDRLAISNGDQLLKQLNTQEGRLADVLVCGHVHQSHGAWHQGIRILATPATSIQARPVNQDFIEDTEAAGFRCFELQANGAWNTQVMRLSQSSVCHD